MKSRSLLLLFFTAVSCSTFRGPAPLVYQTLEPLEEDRAELLWWPVPELKGRHIFYSSITAVKPAEAGRIFPIPIWLPRKESPPVAQRTVTVTPPTADSSVPFRSAEVIPAAPPASPVEAQDPPPYLEDRSLTVEGGVDPLIVLEGGGWKYKSELLDGGEFSLKEESRNLQDTSYLFSPPNAGTYHLQFQKMDYSEGRLHIVRYGIEVLEAFVQEGASPAVAVNPEEETTAEETQESVEKSFVDLKDSEIAFVLKQYEQKGDTPSVIAILEEAMTRNVSEEELAGYYYKLARILEQQGQTQDLNRSYRLYEAILSQFFLSSYYDLAEDRLRYLDRHYFMLQ